MLSQGRIGPAAASQRLPAMVALPRCIQSGYRAVTIALDLCLSSWLYDHTK
ncbi:hypothetical protein SAMN04488044_2137 [Cognatishimia maritima]|uniref:Uncharacterized protein n=1 Tax=Cognatishimia maritima TaxID=870908 RepID=A0A1M5QXE1_9RHOB|nr:hypothetical protein SAMN04488044_2137 [Cognatishimia maritima]